MDHAYHLNVAAEIKSDQTMFSNLLCPILVRPVQIVAFVSFSYLIGAASGGVSAAVVHLLQGLTCCALQRWYSMSTKMAPSMAAVLRAPTKLCRFLGCFTYILLFFRTGCLHS